MNSAVAVGWGLLLCRIWDMTCEWDHQVQQNYKNTIITHFLKFKNTSTLFSFFVSYYLKMWEWMETKLKNKFKQVAFLWVLLFLSNERWKLSNEWWKHQNSNSPLTFVRAIISSSIVFVILTPRSVKCSSLLRNISNTPCFVYWFLCVSVKPRLK